MTSRRKLSLIARLSCVVTLSLCFNTAAMAAQDNVVFVTSSPTNTLKLSIEPENQLSLTVSGEYNGGFGQAWPALPVFASAYSQPGLLAQTGTGNRIDMTVLGSNNLFAMVQNGSGNQATGHVFGTGNAALVTQTGHGNTATFRQQGTGNSLAISQSSW